MEKILKAEVLKLGDNIDTDLICPGKYLELTDHKAIGSHCLAGVSEAIAPNFKEGDLVVAGRNFGCGSSREHAAIALVNMGAGAVIAESFARIFYRNGINLGLPLVVCPGVHELFEEGDKAELDLEQGILTNCTTGKSLPCDRFSDKTLEILNAGGIKALMKQKHTEH